MFHYFRKWPYVTLNWGQCEYNSHVMHSHIRGNHRAKLDDDDFNSFRGIACEGHAHTHARTHVCTHTVTYTHSKTALAYLPIMAKCHAHDDNECTKTVAHVPSSQFVLISGWVNYWDQTGKHQPYNYVNDQQQNYLKKYYTKKNPHVILNKINTQTLEKHPHWQLINPLHKKGHSINIALTCHWWGQSKRFRSGQKRVIAEGDGMSGLSGSAPFPTNPRPEVQSAGVWGPANGYRRCTWQRHCKRNHRKCSIGKMKKTNRSTGKL